MDESENVFDREEQMVEDCAEEYRRLHFVMGALKLGLDTGVERLTEDVYQWYENELEKRYMFLESFGAERCVEQIEKKNNAILAARKKVHK